MIRLTLAVVLLLLGACSSGGAGQRSAEPAVQQPEWPEPVGQVVLQSPQSLAGRRLDVGLALFDPGIPADESTHSELDVFPRIRRAEALYMPVLLRQALIDSDAWGVVRVLPEPEPSSELLVSGRIMHSDGLRLVLSVRAVDATGREWLNRVYHDESSAADFPVVPEGEPFADLYRAIANDLLRVRSMLGPERLENVARIAQLRYAESLSPDAFAGYLQTDDSGVYSAVRLPAADDPMLGRVNRIRNQEFLFIDTVDEQFLDLNEELSNTYNLWREYAREQALHQQAYRERVSGRGSQGRRGSFYAMQRSYDAYKWTRIHEQDLDELAGGFNNEVQPTVLETEGRVYRLGGSLDTQYGEWRRILRQIFALETGLEPASGG